MKIIRIIAIFVLFAVWAATDAQAQINENAGEANSGSFYSLYGVGFPVDISSTQERAAGIFGVSVDNLNASTLQNPAMWGINSYTTATSGFSISQYDAADQSAKSVNALFEASFLQITLPLLRGKLGLSASLYPETRSNYRYYYTENRTIAPDDTLNYAIDNQGVGGVNKLEIGFGWNINNRLAIGYAPSFVFMSKNVKEVIAFDRSDFATSNLNTEITGVAMGHRFGVLYAKPAIFNDKDRISVGASVTLPVSFEAEERTYTNKEVNNVEQEVQINDTNRGNVKLPIEINTGLTYYPSSLVNLSLEGQFQQWSEFEYELQPGEEEYMSDRYRLGLGTQYHPYQLGSEKFLSKFKYSAGVTYDTGHLTIDNQNIETLWFSAGLGILSPRSRSSVDVSFRYGLRGTTSANLVQERIWAINLSVNLAELMFFRPKLN